MIFSADFGSENKADGTRNRDFGRRLIPNFPQCEMILKAELEGAYLIWVFLPRKEG